MNATHISSINYISKLGFNYFVTYSFHRKREYVEFLEFSRQELKQNNGDINKSRSYLNIQTIPPRLTINKTQFNPTAEKIRIFGRNENEAQTLIAILSTPLNDIPAWMCRPFYRDGIVFYDSADNIISVLNICLECEYMQLDDETYIDADAKSYLQFRDFFKLAGHKIEDRYSV